MTVDLPLRPKDATEYTPYKRLSITHDFEDGEDNDKVYQDMQLEIQRLYYTKTLPDDAYLQLHHEAEDDFNKAVQESSIEDIHTQGREQPKKVTPFDDSDLAF